MDVIAKACLHNLNQNVGMEKDREMLTKVYGRSIEKLINWLAQVYSDDPQQLQDAVR